YLPNVETPRAGGNPRWGRLRSGNDGSKGRDRPGGTKANPGALCPRTVFEESDVIPASETPSPGVPPGTGRLYIGEAVGRPARRGVPPSPTGKSPTSAAPPPRRRPSASG